MPAAAMNHFTILTDNLDGTLAFYADLLDLHPGKRPPFKFPGAWLYARNGNEPILHVIAGKDKKDLVKGVIDAAERAEIA
jgi:catechol 2,3-dioxygenase-like lactoylglutathione lyase family enzyme